MSNVGEAMTFVENLQRLVFADAEQIIALQVVRESKELADLRREQRYQWSAWGDGHISQMTVDEMREELRARRAYAASGKWEVIQPSRAHNQQMRGLALLRALKRLAKQTDDQMRNGNDRLEENRIPHALSVMARMQLRVYEPR